LLTNFQTVDYSKQTMRGMEQDFTSPAKRLEQSDSDIDFQARAAESDADETAEEDDEDVNVEELRNPDARPSRGIARSQGSPRTTQGMSEVFMCPFAFPDNSQSTLT
jgi:hypothetical protein